MRGSKKTSCNGIARKIGHWQWFKNMPPNVFVELKYYQGYNVTDASYIMTYLDGSFGNYIMSYLEGLFRTNIMTCLNCSFGTNIMTCLNCSFGTNIMTCLNG